VATCTTTALTSGSITATYLGDTNYATSTSTGVSFTITSSTESVPGSPLVISSTSGPYNAPLTLTTTGGSGSGAITFSATNGTATGCSVSGTSLSFTSSGTCLVTAAQAADGTYLGQSSNVTTVTLFSSYAATWTTVISSYTCGTGATLSYNGSSFVCTYTAMTSCANGGVIESGNCVLQLSNVYQSSCVTNSNGTAVWTSLGYNAPWYGYCTWTEGETLTCPSGGTLSGTNCIYAATPNYSSYWTCPLGGTLSSSNCFLSTGSTAPPNPPTSVIATNNGGSILVIWVAPAISGATAITGYTVTATDTTNSLHGGQTCTSSTNTSCTVSSLTLGDTYTFAVTATNYSGYTSSPSVASNAVVPSTVPGAPTAVSATPGASQATVSWTAPTNNGGSAITGYTVSSSPIGSSCSTTGATSCVVPGLTNGTSYTFTVVARNVSGGSPSSSPSSPVTPLGAPGAPTSVSATGGNAQASVSWTAPANNGGSAITGYAVTSSPGALTCTTTGATTCTVSGLTNGTSYTFTVTATNAIGTGAPSSPSNAVTPATIPGAPASVSAAVNQNQSSVITWTAPASNGGSTITGYTVTASPGGHTCTTTGALTCTITGLTNGFIYEFNVSATNVVGTGAVTWNNIPITVSTTPGAPSGASAVSNASTQATVTWTAPATNGGAPVMGYTVTATDTTHSANGGQVCTENLTPTLIGVGSGGGDVAVVGTTAFVSNGGSGTVSVVNLTTNAVVATVTVGTTPVGITANPAGTQVWVANETSNSVTVISATSPYSVVTTITSGIGTTPKEIAFNTSGSTAYVTEAAGTLNANQVTAINTTSYATTPIPMSWYPSDVWVNSANTYLYVSDAYGLNVINISTHADTIIGGGVYPDQFAVNPAGTYAYGVNWSDDTVSVWNLSTLTLTTTIALPSSYGYGPADIVINPAGTYAYVINEYASTVTVITLSTNTAQTNATLEAWVYPTGIGMNAAGTYLYTKNSGSATMSVIPIAPALTCTLTGLTHGDNYTFTVTANNYSGTGSSSAASNSVTP